ncbi:hypothetical protein ACPPVO_34935 [Dactylosporangium sp. McL0621]|uniref:hypothetical protein n=1 Tax=Dactylosporangium sp. McL0621 TaxID=3415678 RepID=UPI003CEE95EE
MSRDERGELYEAMMRWYFADGDGIFASAATRDLFVAVRTNLTGPVASLRPTVLAAELASLPDDRAERRRGCLAIRQASLLRMQLKADLSLHFGFRYYSTLRADERALLRECGIPPWRRPWRRALREPARRGAPNPCVCGLCGIA